MQRAAAFGMRSFAVLALLLALATASSAAAPAAAAREPGRGAQAGAALREFFQRAMRSDAESGVKVDALALVDELLVLDRRAASAVVPPAPAVLSQVTRPAPHLLFSLGPVL